jgi:hypothetical protein
MTRFTNIAEIKTANKNAGRFWFSPDTVRHFAARVESRVYDAGTNADYPLGSRLWVESTRTFNDGREYKIARFNVETSDISYVHVNYRTLQFGSKATAVKALEGLL